jgi:NAD(P)-dependent dehydrogenase (short-subunit alcohol dehydrogenase family)
MARTNHYDFRGQVALVTGGNSGIGAATVRQLKAGGAKVAVADITVLDDGAHAPDLHADLWLHCDVSSSEAVDAAVSTTIRELGGLDILVCAAGISGRPSQPWELTDAEWRRLQSVNADGTFFACRAAARHMVEARSGRIVNVASAAGLRGPAMLAGYASSKAAVIALTQSLGLALAPYGVLVNAVTPGLIRTPLIGKTDEGAQAVMVSRMAIKRMGEPDEVARLIAFMCSDDLSFTTGAWFDISAGRTLT